MQRSQSVDSYISTLFKSLDTRPVSVEEQGPLVERAKDKVGENGKVIPGDERARLRLFGAVFKYAWRKANQNAKRRDNIQPEDLITVSWEAVLHAIRKFEPARNFKFLTYAGYWIVQYQMRYVQGNGVVRQPAYRYSGEHVESASIVDQVMSLDNPLSGGGVVSDILQLEDESSDTFDAMFDQNEKREKLRLILSAATFLPIREYFALVTTETESLTLKEAADEIGVTRERIRQLRNSGLARINGIFENWRKIPKINLPDDPTQCIADRCKNKNHEWEGGRAFRCKKCFSLLVMEAMYEGRMGDDLD